MERREERTAGKAGKKEEWHLELLVVLFQCYQSSLRGPLMWSLFKKAVWPTVKDTGLRVKPESPSTALYRPNNPQATCTTQPQCPHLDWKVGEDQDFALFTVIFLQTHRAPGNT